MKTLQTLSAFAAEHQLTIKSVRANSNPHMPDKPGHIMDHWTVTLRSPVGSMTLPFSTGLGLRKNGFPVPPEIETVLDCLVSDAWGAIECPSFEDWCAEYGYDSESRKAELTYKAIMASKERLEAAGANVF